MENITSNANNTTTFISTNKKNEDESSFGNLKEEDVGILEYINKESLGFNCVLKHRYSDFLVNEIDMEGNVVWIKTDKKNENDKKVISNTNDNNLNSTTSEEEIEKLINKNFLDTEIIKNKVDIQNLKSFIYNYYSDNEESQSQLTIEFIEDKNSRKLFHEKIRELFNFLETETLNEGQQFKHTQRETGKSKKNMKRSDRSKETQGYDPESNITTTTISTDPYINKKRIIIFIQKNKGNFQGRRKVFPDNKRCLHFVMLKRNFDTVQAVSYIARNLHRSGKSIKFAGNKDKRGITTQKISVINTVPEELTNLTRQRFWDRRIEIGNFEFKEEELRLGLLKGNQFSVVFRFIEFEKSIENIKEEIEKSLNSIFEKGFINYFGMQRFGVSTISTHRIGVHVIKKQWKEAVINILNTYTINDALRQLGLKKDEYSFEEFAKIFESSENISDIMKMIPKYSSEFKILSCIKKTGKNAFQNAFKSLNRQLQVLYPHAYQSYIWNQTVSERIKNHGRKLLIGDIVRKNKNVDDLLTGIEIPLDEVFDSPDAIINEEDENIENENDEKNTNTNENVNITTNTSSNEKIFEENYEYITEENINNYTINDLYIPMVGFQVKYPKNSTYDYIIDFLKKEEIKLEDFAYQNVNFNSTGYFRKVIENAKEMKFELISHDNSDEDLQNEYYNVEPHPKPKSVDNKYTSLRLQFQLPQSTYATMLFRELTKKESAVYYQSNLSKNIK
jgi:tRNA pseudouridine13 synthase